MFLGWNLRQRPVWAKPFLGQHRFRPTCRRRVFKVGRGSGRFGWGPVRVRGGEQGGRNRKSGGPEGWWPRRVGAPKGGGPEASRVSHDSPRTPNVHISGPGRFKHHQNSTKKHPREGRKKETCGGRWKNSEILGSPPFVPPTRPKSGLGQKWSGQKWPKERAKGGPPPLSLPSTPPTPELKN